MKKQRLIKTLLTASQLEESHSNDIANFFIENFDWSGIEKEKVERVKAMLKFIRVQTSEHERILNELVGKIQSSDKDDF